MGSKWIKKKQHSDEALRMARMIGELHAQELFGAADLIYRPDDEDHVVIAGLLKEILLGSGKPPAMMAREQTWMCPSCDRAIVDYGTMCINCRNKARDESSDSSSIGIAQISNE